MNILSIDGTALSGIYVDASLSFNKPEKDVETYRVPGRNGDLVIDYDTWHNVLITFPCYIKGNFDTAFDSLCQTLGALKGYHRIECSNDTTHFRLGRAIVPMTPDATAFNKSGFFDLAFDCKPQRFLTSGETEVIKNASGTISNPTAFEARPMIRVYGNGTVTVNGTAITLTNNTGYTDIDCEAMTCFYGTTSRNNDVSFSTNDFPTLSPGSNTLTFGTGITQIRITPRWWEL